MERTLRYLTDGSDLVLTPRFSPTNQQVAYMAYPQTGQPQSLSAGCGKRQTEFAGQFPEHDLFSSLLAGREAKSS